MIGLAAILAAAAAPVVSPAPDTVALTIYRSPAGWRRGVSLDSLDGFALVTETRRIHVPAGKAVLRFEGVADGIIPASAIVTGLPGGTIEKNRDARLLSPFSLVDGTLGREVTVRRTNKLTGAVREEKATIVAVPTKDQGGVVMRTPEGIETWRCPGLPEKLRFDGVPPGLSAKPVLSVATRSPRAADVRVTLAYLASGFDWSASYVATLDPASDRLDLFAWATLANGNGQAFPNASVKVVAGRLQRRSDREIAAAATLLKLHCYPAQTTTSNLPVIGPYVHIEAEDLRKFQDVTVTGVLRRVPAPVPAMAMAPPAPPPPPPPEDLGDLKLYRVPQPVTVSSRGQKQVALLVAPHVRFEKIYRIELPTWRAVDSASTSIVLRVENVSEEGLGMPLPRGTTSLYQQRDGGRLLIGLGSLGDTAKGEKARIGAGISRQVVVSQRLIDSGNRQISLSNANPFPVRVEIPIGQPGEPDFWQPSLPLERIEGVQTWRVTLPANGAADLRYTVRKP
jgi:hypothetical protein